MLCTTAIITANTISTQTGITLIQRSGLDTIGVDKGGPAPPPMAGQNFFSC